MASGGMETFPPGYLEEYRGWVLITVACVFAVLECVLVALRLYARKVSRAGLGWDDYWSIITLVRVLMWSVEWSQLANRERRYYVWGYVRTR